MRLWNRLSIKIPILTLIIALGPLIFIGYKALTETQKRLLQQIQLTNAETARRAADIAEVSITGIIGRIKVGLSSVQINLDDPFELEWSLTVLQKEIPEVFQFTMMDSRGDEKAKIGVDKVYSADSFGNKGLDPAFEAALKNQVHIGEIKTSSNGMQRLKLALPIVDPKERSVSGVLFAEVYVQKITEKISQMTVGKSGIVFVLDSGGKIIAHPDLSKVLSGESYADHPHFQHLVEKNGHDISELYPYKNQDGKEILITGYQSKMLGWVFMVEQSRAEAFSLIDKMKYNLTVLLCITMVMVILVTLYFFKKLNKPLRQLQSAAELIGKGDLEQRLEIKSNDEVGEVSKAFNIMAQNLHQISTERKRRNWLKTGRADLEDRMRGEQSIETLCRNIVTFMAKYLKAQIGAIYVNENNERLRLMASYAYTVRKNVSNEFGFGEGLVGQAALEKEAIVLANVPDDYIAVTSGLGETKPKNILVFPLIFNNDLMGIIELGTLNEFSELDRAFLEDTQNGMAIAIHTARVRVELTQALELTQKQKANLQEQQEELRVSNEELEEQTIQLKESEKRLQYQQEELRATNEEMEEKARELEEKTRELEEKKEALEINNSVLLNIQEEMKQKAVELQTTSRYKSEFLANMSHELRTPLNSLLLLARDLSENKTANLDPDQLESAKIIHNSGQDLLNLINEILDLSKIEAGQMKLNFEKVQISRLVDDISEIFNQMAKEKGLAFNTSVDKALPEQIRMDPQRAEQILRNLVSNAIKFTNNGSVTIRFHRPDDRVTFSRSDLDPRRSLAISVVDTGIGIPADKLDEIFEAFRQIDGSTSRSQGGTGLGLSISRELARLLGGEIGLESEKGKGSTFTLYLPIEEGANKSEATGKPIYHKPGQPHALPKPDTRKISVEDDRDRIGPDDRVILIIEDDLAFARTLGKLCHERGFKCLHAPDGEAGAEMAVEYEPDAIVLDIRLPRKNGWEVLDILKNDPKLRHIPVHMMSVDDETMNACRKGAIGFLSKPVTKEMLDGAFEKIEGALAKGPKKLLVIEDDPMIQRNIISLIEGEGVDIKAVSTGEEAISHLLETAFDCVILDLKLPDMSGFELLEKLKNQTMNIPPIIVYTAREITREEDDRLQQYAASIIIKGVRSEERLLDETSLFLHQVVGNMPDRKQKIISKLYSGDDIFENKKVLIVDDDMRNVFAMSKLLQDKGMEVFKAPDGMKALSSLDANPEMDLVLMDIMMPVMDGYEAMRRIREQDRFKDLPIIAVTAKAMKDDREKCIEAGASDYFSKPVEMDRLLSLMRVWLYK